MTMAEDRSGFSSKTSKTSRILFLDSSKSRGMSTLLSAFSSSGNRALPMTRETKII